MSKFTHEGTEALQHLAEEIERERREKGRTPFDDVPESDEATASAAEEHGDSIHRGPAVRGADGAAAAARMLRK